MEESGAINGDKGRRKMHSFMHSAFHTQRPTTVWPFERRRCFARRQVNSVRKLKKKAKKNKKKKKRTKTRHSTQRDCVLIEKRRSESFYFALSQSKFSERSLRKDFYVFTRKLYFILFCFYFIGSIVVPLNTTTAALTTRALQFLKYLPV